MGSTMAETAGHQRSVQSLATLQPKRIASNAVLAMVLFVIMEAMLFAAFISAFVIGESAAPGGWPPPGQPRLPVTMTLINTLALLASGGLLFHAHRKFKLDIKRARVPMAAALLLGTWFVVGQGIEWAQLINEGLTLTTSTHGAFFYIIVGLHALHAIAAIIALGYIFVRTLRGTVKPEGFYATQIFWYFVVGVWPALYMVVYL